MIILHNLFKDTTISTSCNSPYKVNRYMRYCISQYIPGKYRAEYSIIDLFRYKHHFSTHDLYDDTAAQNVYRFILYIYK